MPENAVAPAAPDDDRTPTQEDVPVAASEVAWKMPEPVFRCSEGYTPQRRFAGNEDETITPEAIAGDKGGDDTASKTAAASVADIAEQPEILEDPDSETTITAIEPTGKKKTGWFRIFLIIAAIVLVGVAAATVIFGVALGYFFQVSESQNLN